ncbi:MAG TPA: amidohydrolase family protein, partial [bacterium]|nr:amidohydrolase family protein [bacterium]
EQVIRAMSWAPARILGLPAGTLETGSAADVTVIDPARRWTVHAAGFASRSRNTPFEGWELEGKAVLTIVGGSPVHNELSAGVVA